MKHRAHEIYGYVPARLQRRRLVDWPLVARIALVCAGVTVAGVLTWPA